MKIRALATLACVSILFIGCGDDAKPKGSVVVPDNNSNNQNNANSTNGSNNGTTSGSNNGTNVGSNNGSNNCDEGRCELVCSVFADPDFCWNRARNRVYECMRDQVNGTMNSTGETCRVGDVSIEFANTLDAETIADVEDWDFEIIQDGVSCARVVSNEGFELTTRRGIVRIEVSTDSYQIVCEDGSTWSTTDFASLFECVDNEGFSTLPGSTSFTSGNEFGVGLLPGSGNLFQCVFE